MVLLGLLGVYINWSQGHEMRYIAVSSSLLLVGLGSAAFHGTLTHVGQQGDETPMVIANWSICTNATTFRAMP